MSYKTIVVHMTDERRLPRLLDAAIAIAAGCRAHIIGVSCVPPVIVPPPSELAVAVSVIDTHRKAYLVEEARMKAAFEAATSAKCADGTLTAEWRSLDCRPLSTCLEALMPVARTADLVIASQADPDWPLSDMLEYPDDLATASGRPVLLIPNKPRASAFKAQRIVVAWNGKREATRAVFDAIPLLKAADETKVLWIDPGNDGATAGDLPSADLCASLARHGIKCEETASVSPKMSAGETLLFETEKFGWDLLVMGCYGHSRLREFILGGATRHVLSHMTVPVLMSH
jgi:nucleotide-binding universal stress UspA family protein